MSFRKKRMVLLSSVVLLLLLSILDISFRKEEILEVFGGQFYNEQKTEAYNQAHQGFSATAQRQLEINRDDVKEVLLSSIGGKISVKRADNHTIGLQYTVTASGNDREAANRKSDAVQVEEEVQNGRLTLVAKADGKQVNNDSIAIDYVLLIPDAMKLQIDHEDGAVRIKGITGDVVASSDRGMLEIVDVRGNLSLETTDGSLFLSGITGNIDLVNHHSHANMDDVKGNVVFKSQFGQNDINRMEGKVTGDSEIGAIHLREITGPVELNCRGTNVQLDHIQGDAKLISESGETTILLPEVVGYTLDAAVSGGDILTQLPNKKEEGGDYTHHVNGVVGDGKWKVDVKARSGDIILHVK